MRSLEATECSEESGPIARPAIWAPLARFIEAEARIGAWAEQRTIDARLYEFIRFGIKQGWACLFGALMLALLIGTHLFYPRAPARPLRLPCPGRTCDPGGMLAFRLETWEEAKVIFVFHVVGTIMEVFKTRRAPGSIRSPPCCASAACRCSPASCMPRSAPTSPAAGACSTSASRTIRRYGHRACWRRHLRQLLRAPLRHRHARWPVRLRRTAVRPCRVHYKIWRVHRRMPLLVGLVLVALFIWLAENIGTFARPGCIPTRRRLAAGVAGQARRLVPADDHLLHANSPYIPG